MSHRIRVLPTVAKNGPSAVNMRTASACMGRRDHARLATTPCERADRAVCRSRLSIS
jgi:hypothetical protein